MSSPPQLALIASEREWAVRSLDSILSPSGYTVLSTGTGFSVLEKVRTVEPDVFLLDNGLSDINGVNLCRMLRTSGSVRDITPVVITSAEPVTRELRLAALRAGAWECLGFPLDSEELLLKLQVYLAARTEAMSLREVSLLDHRTGFYSARGLLRRVRELASEADRHGRPLACVAMAPALETNGDAAAPALERDTVEAVRGLTHLLEHSLRTSDSVGRLGEYDFLVLAPDTGAAGAYRLAERLSAAAAAPGLPSTTPLQLRAGYFAVDNFHDAAVEPVDMLVRASLALRRAQGEPEGDPIRPFEPPSALA